MSDPAMGGSEAPASPSDHRHRYRYRYRSTLVSRPPGEEGIVPWPLPFIMAAMDNIINFPGGDDGKKPAARQQSGAADERVSPPGQGVLGIPGLTEDQEKAMQLIVSGDAFVLVAIRPTDTGADFFTAIDGQKDDLRNAQDHLPGVIDRLYSRRGI